MNKDTQQILKAINALDWRLSHVLAQIAEKLSPDWQKVLVANSTKNVEWPIDDDAISEINIANEAAARKEPDWVTATKAKEKSDEQAQ